MTEENQSGSVQKMVETEPSDDQETTATANSEDELQEELGLHLRSPNDTDMQSRFTYNPDTYQAEVVEQDAESTTEKPTEAPDAAAAAASTESETVAPTDAATTETPAQAKSGDATVTKTPEGGVPQPAAETKETSGTTGTDEKSGQSPSGETSTDNIKEESKDMPADATAAEEPKDPYMIDIPLQKKINKRTQRKLWEEIEKRKPLIPRHVAEHIQKYAKPPFETWGCKYKGRGSCFGCR